MIPLYRSIKLTQKNLKKHFSLTASAIEAEGTHDLDPEIIL